MVFRGSDIFNYYSCKTRFWLARKNISGDYSNSDHIQIGKLLDSETFKRNKKSVIIDGQCQIDFVQQGDSLEVHEIKKGRYASKPQIMQVKYYMHILNALTGEKIRGFIHLPQVRKKIAVDPDDDGELSYALNDMENISNGPCPKPEAIPIFKGCSFREICWS